MENKKSIWILGGAVLIVLLAVLFWPGSSGSGVFGGTTNYDSLSVGGDLAVTGNSTHTGPSAFNSRATFGGVYSTSTTGTLLESQLLGVGTISANPPTAAITLTLPASSTLTTLIPNSGDSVRYVIVNLATVSASSTTIAGGTGTTISNSTSTTAIVGGRSAILTLVRLATTNVLAILDIQN